MTSFKIFTAIVLAGSVLAAPQRHGGLAATVSCPNSNSTTYTSSNGISFVIECGLDRPGDINMVYTNTFSACIDACAKYTGCVDVSYVSNGGGACYMKNSVASPGYSPGIWGARQVSIPVPTVSNTRNTKTKTHTKTHTKTSVKSSAAPAPTTSKKTIVAPVSTTKTTLAPVPTTTQSPSQTTGKRGIAYGTGAYGAYFTSSPQVTWGYDVSHFFCISPYSLC